MSPLPPEPKGRNPYVKEVRVEVPTKRSLLSVLLVPVLALAVGLAAGATAGNATTDRTVVKAVTEYVPGETRVVRAGGNTIAEEDVAVAPCTWAPVERSIAPEFPKPALLRRHAARISRATDGAPVEYAYKKAEGADGWYLVFFVLDCPSP